MAAVIEVRLLRRIATLLIVFAGIASLSLPAAAARDPFIGDIYVNGNTVLSQREVERVIYPFLGPDGGADRVAQAASALEAVYREKGYPTVGVTPAADFEQQLKQGFATLDVYEQRVDKVKITGGRYFGRRQIREAVPSLERGKVLNATDLQSELDKLSKRSADRVVAPILRAGDEPGKVDVELRIEDQFPLSTSFALTNFANANTTELRASASVRYDNLFQQQHSLGLFYQVSPENLDDVSVATATYIHRPKWTDAIFAITGVVTESDVAAVGGVNVLGDGTFIITRAIFPIASELENRVQSLSFGVDYKNSNDSTGFRRSLTDTVDREEITERRIDYLNWSVGYDLTNRLWGGTHKYSLSANFGFRGLMNERDEFEEKRFKGEPNYFFLKYAASRYQPLPWRDAGLDIALSGQLTGDQLIGNEQMSIGGFRTVRGYLEAEELVDYGLIGQLRFDAPSYRPFGDRGGVFRGYAFWHGGVGRLHEPLPGELNQITLASVGLGLRFYDFQGLTAEAAWAYPLETGNNTGRGDDRVTFQISYDM